MDIQTQKALSNYVTQKVNEGKSIKRSVENFLRSTPDTEIVDSKNDANMIFGTHKIHTDKANEFTVQMDSDDYLVTVYHYQAPLISNKQVYSINVQKL